MSNLVSVCIPSYNNGKYIAETISSVLTQTYSDLEIIIVDDCSSDNTAEVVRGFSDPRISFVQNETNLGMHGNWSKALSLARGKYIKLLCGDDLIYPDCISLQVESFLDPANSDVVLVGARRKIIRADGTASFGSFYKLVPGKYKNTQVLRYCVSLGTNMVGEPMSVLFNGDVFRDNRIRLGSNNYLIDLDLYAKLLVHGNFVMRSEYLSAFRIYSASMTGSLGLSKHSAYFNEFVSQPWLKKAFGIKWFHRLTGRILEFNLSLARAAVLRLSRQPVKSGS